MKDLSKTPMLLLIWQVQERKLNIELISNLSTFKSLKELQRLVLKKVFIDWFIFQLQELMRILNLWIFKQKQLDSKLLKKLSQMQPFSDHAQFLERMIILLQIFKDKHIILWIISFLFMMILQLWNNQLKILILENVF